MPRLTISSAISCAVQWLIGRPESSGSSQAIASIWQRCSAVISAGAPGRGISSNRSSTFRSSKAMGCRVNQRLRHKRAVSLWMPSSRATCRLSLPSAAASTIRPRKAICWRVLWRRTSASRASRSSSASLTSGGLSLGIAFPFAFAEFANCTQFAPDVKRTRYLSRDALVPLEVAIVDGRQLGQHAVLLVDEGLDLER